MTTYPLVFRVRKNRAGEPLCEGRFGQRCRVVVTATRMNSVLIEFEDGWRAVTSLNYLRRSQG